MPRDEHHVVPDKNGGWDVKRKDPCPPKDKK